MTQAISKSELMTLEEFLDWYPEDGGRYELHKGVLVEMEPSGTHEQVISFIIINLAPYIKIMENSHLLFTGSIIKSINADNSGFNPDLALVDKNALKNEPMWKPRATITKGETIKLVVEVVSHNWRNDYDIKIFEYEKLGIYEYWIVDYLGLGGRRFIGNPKQPTISIYQMVDGEYEVQLFRGSDKIESSIFPELNLTAQQIFDAEQ